MPAYTPWQLLSLCVFFPLPSRVDVHVLIFCVCALIQPVTSWRLYGMKFLLLSRP
jgi:hypothetical protein